MTRLLARLSAFFAIVLFALPVTAQDFPSDVLKDVYEQTPVTSQCANPSFEKGFQDWTGFRAARVAGKPAENFLNGLTPLLSTDCVSAPGIGDKGSGNSCHLEVSEGFDDNLPNAGLASVDHLKKSIRLGGRSLASDKSDGGVVEGVAKRFVVTKANARYRFRYSSVMEQGSDGPDYQGDEAYFHAYAIDPATGKIVAEYFRPAVGEMPGVARPVDFKGKSGAPVLHIPWTCAELDLTAHLGEELIVYFVNSDGASGDTTSYTYLDRTCTACAVTAEAVEVTPEPPPATTAGACLTPDIKVSCGTKPGTHVVTLNLKNADGSSPDSVELEISTPGIAFVSGQKHYPVGEGGVVKVLLKGAKPGDVIEFTVNGSKKDTSSPLGLSTCCNSKVQIEIPAGLSCPKKNLVDLAMFKEGGIDPALGPGNYLFNLDVVNAGPKISKASAIEVTDTVPAGMTFTGALGVDWQCSSLPANEGEEVTCSYSGSGPVWSGQLLPSILIQAKADGDGPFENCANVAFTGGGSPIELTPANNKACAVVSPVSALYLAMACGPATPDPSGGYLASCEITVTTLGKQAGLLSINDGIVGAGAAGALNNTTSPRWSCSGATCKIKGDNLDQTSSTSVFQVDVRLPNESSVKSAKNCALAKNPSAKDLECALFEIAEAPLKLVDPPKPPKEDPKPPKVDPKPPKEDPKPPKAPRCERDTTRLVDGECRCTIRGMVKVSATACACPRGEKVINGRCREPAPPPPPPPKCDSRSAKFVDGACRCIIRGAVPISKTACACPKNERIVNGRCQEPPPPAPKCERATTIAQGDGCACRFRGMAKISPTACACTKGRDFQPGVGCISPEPVCKRGTRFNDDRGRCEPICGEGERYNARRNRCEVERVEPRCDPATTVAKGGECVCKFEGMRNRGNSCVCRRGQKFVRGEGCFGRNDNDGNDGNGGDTPPPNKCRPPRFIDPDTGRCVRGKIEVSPELLDLFKNRKRKRRPQEEGPVFNDTPVFNDVR